MVILWGAYEYIYIYMHLFIHFLFLFIHVYKHAYTWERISKKVFGASGLGCGV